MKILVEVSRSPVASICRKLLLSLCDRSGCRRGWTGMWCFPSWSHSRCFSDFAEAVPEGLGRSASPQSQRDSEIKRRCWEPGRRGRLWGCLRHVFFFFPATTGFVPVKSLKDLTESAKGVLPRGRCLVTAPAGSLCLTSRCKQGRRKGGRCRFSLVILFAAGNR